MAGVCPTGILLVVQEKFTLQVLFLSRIVHGLNPAVRVPAGEIGASLTQVPVGAFQCEPATQAAVTTLEVAMVAPLWFT
jgi:hypothetical protein